MASGLAAVGGAHLRAAGDVGGASGLGVGVLAGAGRRDGMGDEVAPLDDLAPCAVPRRETRLAYRPVRLPVGVEMGCLIAAPCAGVRTPVPDDAWAGVADMAARPLVIALGVAVSAGVVATAAVRLVVWLQETGGAASRV